MASLARVIPLVHEAVLRQSKPSRERLRRGAILVVALGLHALVLALLARPVQQTFVDRSNDQDAIDVTLDRPRQATRTSARSAASSGAPRRSATTAPAPVDVEPLVLPATSAFGVPPSGPPAAPSSFDLGAVLRSGGRGCEGDRAARLTPEERARCQEKLGALALKAPPLAAPIDPAKRAYYDAVAEAYADRRRAMIPLDARGGRGMFAVDDSVHNGHGPKVGCSVKFGPNADKAPKGPSNALRAGPCFVQPPVGSLTPEADIRKPY